jgi:hypothetical protein
MVIMAEAIPPADDAEKSLAYQEFLQNYWRTQELLLWHKFVEK